MTGASSHFSTTIGFEYQRSGTGCEWPLALVRLPISLKRSFLSEFLSFACILTLFMVCQFTHNSAYVTPWEALFVLWSLGFALDEFASVQENGLSTYWSGAYNVLDALYVLIFLIYLGLRIHGLWSGDEALSDLSFDTLALAGCLLFPRLTISLIRGNVILMALSVSASCGEHIICSLIANPGDDQRILVSREGVARRKRHCFGIDRAQTSRPQGIHVTCMHYLDRVPGGVRPTVTWRMGRRPRGMAAPQSVARLQLSRLRGRSAISSRLWPGVGRRLRHAHADSSYVDVWQVCHLDEDLSLIFASLAVLTILISLLSNTFAAIQGQAETEILHQQSLRKSRQIDEGADTSLTKSLSTGTLERVKSDPLTCYLPPLNLVALLVLLPTRWLATPRWTHKIHVFMTKSLNFPILL